MMMESDRKRLSTPVVKFMTTGMMSPSPDTRSKSFGHNYNSATRTNHQMQQRQLHHRQTTNFGSTIHDSGGSQNVGSMTPLLTPNRKEGHASDCQSPTLASKLTQLASSTAEQLEMIWDDIGYDPQERADQLSALLFRMEEICKAKLAEENGVAEQFRKTIADTKKNMRVTCAALKQQPDARLLRDNDGTVTLTEELQALEDAMRNIQEVASAAKEDLLNSRDYLIEAHEALELEMDPKWRDIESDLTQLRREAFHAKMKEMKEELATRSAAVIQLVRDCQHLMNSIAVDAENGTELDKRIMGSVIRSKDGSFIMASKFRTSTCVGISAKALDELTKRVAELDAEKRRRKRVLQELGSEIGALWDKLNIPHEEQKAFTTSVDGLGMITIERGEAELRRLKKIKSNMLDKLILDARSTIQSLWEETNTPNEQRRSFEAFRVSESMFSDELLDEHEEYLAILQARLEEMKPIVRLIERREEILDERMEYEELQKDSERLQQRGASMTNQLMKEEKMARRIKKELPKLTESLLYQLAEWKAKHNEEFQYFGRVYLDVMDEQEEEWQEYKANEFQRKQMKKKEEMAMAAENRFQPFGHLKKGASRPLGDARPKENSRGGVARTKSGLGKVSNLREGNRQRSDTMT
ncbi:hypothetical protein MPSEU_001097800 [Mayamaea pseudoterrestris]|nr:hypothetical protein MPSEU_001097800 [Mayamaea pseudoterrestris]